MQPDGVYCPNIGHDFFRKSAADIRIYQILALIHREPAHSLTANIATIWDIRDTRRIR
jgi:hypothetical protein